MSETAERIGPEPGAEIAKAERLRLARAELYLMLGMKCDQWRKWMAATDGGKPFEEWPDDDPFRVLAHTYGLNRGDLDRLLDRLGDDMERRAMRAGYDEHWDPLPTHEAPPRSPRRRAG